MSTRDISQLQCVHWQQQLLRGGQPLLSMHQFDYRPVRGDGHLPGGDLRDAPRERLPRRLPHTIATSPAAFAAQAAATAGTTSPLPSWGL